MGLWGEAEVEAVNSFTGNWEAGLSPTVADSPVVATGTLSSVIDPDHNSLGIVLSAVSR